MGEGLAEDTKNRFMELKKAQRKQLLMFVESL